MEYVFRILGAKVCEGMKARWSLPPLAARRMHATVVLPVKVRRRRSPGAWPAASRVAALIVSSDSSRCFSLRSCTCCPCPTVWARVLVCSHEPSVHLPPSVRWLPPPGHGHCNACRLSPGQPWGDAASRVDVYRCPFLRLRSCCASWRMGACRPCKLDGVA